MEDVEFKKCRACLNIDKNGSEMFTANYVGLFIEFTNLQVNLYLLSTEYPLLWP